MEHEWIINLPKTSQEKRGLWTENIKDKYKTKK